MKIAISTTKDEGATLDPRFGRAAAFAVVNSETGELIFLDNPAAHEGGGAGVQAAEFLTRQGVDAVVSGAFGPNAYDVLEAAGVAMYVAESGRAIDLAGAAARGELAPPSGSLPMGRRHRGSRDNA